MISTKLGERLIVSPCTLEYVAGTNASDDPDGISSIVIASALRMVYSSRATGCGVSTCSNMCEKQASRA